MNVTNADRGAVEAWFTEPESAVVSVLGLRSERVLLERKRVAEELVARLRRSSGRPRCKERLIRWASAQLVGWAEEAHKGLVGLQTGDTERLLHAQFGLSWGLAKTVRVQRGTRRVTTPFLTEL